MFSRDPPSERRSSRISGSLWLETGGLFAVWWGDAVLGAEFAPFPFPLPPAGRAGPVRSRLALLWTCSDPLFCKWPAVWLAQLIFSLSLAIPQFKLVSHKSSLRLPSGHSGPVLTLSNAAAPLLSAPTCWWRMRTSGGTFLLGVAFRHVICGFYLLLPSQSGCPPRFKNLPQCEGFLVFGHFLYKTPFPGWISVPSSFVSLPFIFCPTSFRRQWAAFLGS